MDEFLIIGIIISIFVSLLEFISSVLIHVRIKSTCGLCSGAFVMEPIESNYHGKKIKKEKEEEKDKKMEEIEMREVYVNP